MHRIRGHPDCRGCSPRERWFLDWESGVAFLKRRGMLIDSLPERTSEECWKHLFEAAKVLCDATREVIEPGLWCDEVHSKPDGPHPDQVRRNRVWKQLERTGGDQHTPRLKLLVPLRNRASHPATPERREEWVRLQSRVAALLGREWKPALGKSHPEFRAPDDLQLKPLEAMCVKLHLMHAVAAILESARRNGFWNGPRGS